MKNLLLVFFVALLAACGDTQDVKALTLQASGKVEVTPDQASVSLSIKCVNREVEQAKACLEVQTSGLRDSLLKMGIEEKDILTTAVSLQKQYNWQQGSRVFLGYNASTGVSFLVRDLDTIGDIYSALLDNERMTINSLSYGRSDYEKLEREAYLNALGNARLLAESLAPDMPARHVDVVRVTNVASAAGPAPYPQQFRTQSLAMESEGAAVTVNIGNMVIEKTLFVDFVVY